MRPYRLPDYTVSGESDTTLYMPPGAHGFKEYFWHTIELDQACPASVMARMAQTMPRGEFHEMEGVGHYGWGERPAEYHAVIESFLDRALGRSQ